MSRTLLRQSVIHAGRFGLECLSKTCPSAKNCANHVSAGDFRSEGGPTPDLRIEGEEIVCYEVVREDLKGSASLSNDRVIVRDYVYEETHYLHGDSVAAKEAFAAYEAKPTELNHKELSQEIEALPRKPLAVPEQTDVRPNPT